MLSIMIFHGKEPEFQLNPNKLQAIQKLLSVPTKKYH